MFCEEALAHIRSSDYIYSQVLVTDDFNLSEYPKNHEGTGTCELVRLHYHIHRSPVS